MNYEPKEKDIITRVGYPPITVIKITPATAKWEYQGQTMTEPRELFDSLMEKSIDGGAEIHRDGVRIVPPEEGGIWDSPEADKLMSVIEGRTDTAGITGSSNTHARLSPSSSKQWTQCTASVAYIEANDHLVPADTSSVFSQEGTVAHEYAAEVLLKTRAIEDVPNPFRPYVKAYVDYCLALVPEGVDYQVEVSVELFYQQGERGTCDFSVVTDDEIHIADLKYGAGVLVEAQQNTQLAIYGLSLIRMLESIYDFTPETRVSLHVFQPRHHEAENATPWTLSLGELTEFGAEIERQAGFARAAVDAVRDEKMARGVDVQPSEILSISPPEVEFAPGDDTCKFCKAKAFCGVRHAHNTGGQTDMLAIMPDMTAEVLDMEVVTDELVAKDGETLKLEFLAAALKNRKKIEKWLGDVEDYLNRLDHDTITRIGLKYVKGRDGNRVWISEDSAETFAKGQGLKQDERCTIKLKTPAQIEAALKEKLKNARTKNRFEALVTRSEGRPVLVPAEDKRPALPAPGEIMPNMEDEI